MLSPVFNGVDRSTGQSTVVVIAERSCQGPVGNSYKKPMIPLFRVTSSIYLGSTYQVVGMPFFYASHDTRPTWRPGNATYYCSCGAHPRSICLHTRGHSAMPCKYPTWSSADTLSVDTLSVTALLRVVYPVPGIG